MSKDNRLRPATRDGFPNRSPSRRADDSTTAHFKTANPENTNHCRNNRLMYSNNLKQSRLVSGSDNCRNNVGYARTNIPRPSTSNGSKNTDQSDLRITKIVPQSKPKSTRDKFCNKPDKTDDCRYKYGHCCKLDKHKHESILKSCSKVVKPSEISEDEMTPTKLEQTIKIKNEATSSYSKRPTATAIVKPEPPKTNNLSVKPCESPKVQCNALKLPEIYYNNMLYVLPIKQCPETETNMQVVIVHLDPMASRCLESNEKGSANLQSSLEGNMQPEHDQPWKPPEKCITSLKQKPKSEMNSNSKKSNIETTENKTINNSERKKQTEDEPIQTEISIYCPEIQTFYNIPELNNNCWPSTETFTIETKNNFEIGELDEHAITTFPSRSCQTGKQEENYFHEGSTSYKNPAGPRLNNYHLEDLQDILPNSNDYHAMFESNIYPKTCDTIFRSKRYPHRSGKYILYKPRSGSLDRQLDNMVFEPQLYQYPEMNQDVRNDFLYTKYLNLNHKYFPPSNKIVCNNTEISYSHRKNATVRAQGIDNKEVKPPRSHHVSTNTESKFDPTVISIFAKKNASIDVGTSTSWEEQDEININEQNLTKNRIPVETSVNREPQVYPKPMYMVYYESHMYQQNKQQQSIQTDVCNNLNYIEDPDSRFAQYPYQPFDTKFNQTTFSKENVEDGDYLVAKYVIAEDRSSQTIAETCNCLIHQSVPNKNSTDDVNEKFVQNKICQFNEPIHKAIEYNKNECRFFKTYKTGINKVASTSVSFINLNAVDTAIPKKTENENLDISKQSTSSVSCTCCRLDSPVVKSCKPCMKVTSKSSSCTCLFNSITKNKLDNPKIDTESNNPTRYSEPTDDRFMFNTKNMVRNSSQAGKSIPNQICQCTNYSEITPTDVLMQNVSNTKPIIKPTTSTSCTCLFKGGTKRELNYSNLDTQTLSSTNNPKISRPTPFSEGTRLSNLKTITPSSKESNPEEDNICQCANSLVVSPIELFKQNVLSTKPGIKPAISSSCTCLFNGNTRKDLDIPKMKTEINEDKSNPKIASTNARSVFISDEHLFNTNSTSFPPANKPETQTSDKECQYYNPVDVDPAKTLRDSVSNTRLITKADTSSSSISLSTETKKEEDKLKIVTQILLSTLDNKSTNPRSAVRTSKPMSFLDEIPTSFLQPKTSEKPKRHQRFTSIEVNPLKTLKESDVNTKLSIPLASLSALNTSLVKSDTKIKSSNSNMDTILSTERVTKPDNVKTEDRSSRRLFSSKVMVQSISPMEKFKSDKICQCSNSLDANNTKNNIKPVRSSSCTCLFNSNATIKFDNSNVESPTSMEMDEKSSIPTVEERYSQRSSFSEDRPTINSKIVLTSFSQASKQVQVDQICPCSNPFDVNLIEPLNGSGSISGSADRDLDNQKSETPVLPTAMENRPNDPKITDEKRMVTSFSQASKPEKPKTDKICQCPSSLETSKQNVKDTAWYKKSIEPIIAGKRAQDAGSPCGKCTGEPCVQKKVCFRVLTATGKNPFLHPDRSEEDKIVKTKEPSSKLIQTDTSDNAMEVQPDQMCNCSQLEQGCHCWDGMNLPKNIDTRTCQCSKLLSEYLKKRCNAGKTLALNIYNIDWKDGHSKKPNDKNGKDSLLDCENVQCKTKNVQNRNADNLCKNTCNTQTANERPKSV